MLTIAYLGPEQTNTHVAAQKRFGKRCRYHHAPTVDEVFHLVERRQVDYGVVPIENSLEGAVTRTLDRFIDFVDTPVRIQGEIERSVRHYLILRRGLTLKNVKSVYSHPQALAQCAAWLARNLPSAIQQETASTAEAVQRVLGVESGWRRLGELEKAHGLKPVGRVLEIAAIARKELARGPLRAIPISEERENRTRFLILGLSEPNRRSHSKTSLLFSVKDKPGALHDALVAFKRNRINMIKIESRPSKRKAWEYLFFVDIEGHVSEPRVKRALHALKRSTSFLRVLGSYPISR
jgi:chorismate mutase/prephenate dehydratase